MSVGVNAMSLSETISVILVDTNDRILLVRSRWRRRWELPGGHEKYVSVKDTAFCTLYENTGFIMGAVKRICTSATIPNHVFVVSHEYGGSIQLNRSMYTDYRWVHIVEAGALLPPVLCEQIELFIIDFEDER